MAYDHSEAPEAELNTQTDVKPAAAAIALDGVSKRFGRFPALSGVDLAVRPGELLAVVGPSGSGKTTLLRLIAGLEFPDAGVIRFGDEDVTGVKTSDRRVGFVFQQYALFRHMSVAKNIAFGLDVHRKDKPSRKDRDARVEELLGLVSLEGLGKRYPGQLSGGQRQRVALARALAVSPRVLLLDEPFGALDATVRKSLRRELRRIHQATGVTTVFITHDQEEALELADRVAVLNNGRLEQVGTPEAVLNAPETAFVAGFVGQSNPFEGEVRGGVFRGEGVVLEAGGVADGHAQAFVRPDQFLLASDGFEIRVVRAPPSSGQVRLEVEAAGGRLLEVILPPGDAEPNVAPGRVLRLKAAAGRVFPSQR